MIGIELKALQLSLGYTSTEAANYLAGGVRRDSFKHWCKLKESDSVKIPPDVAEKAHMMFEFKESVIDSFLDDENINYVLWIDSEHDFKKLTGKPKEFYKPYKMACCELIAGGSHAIHADAETHHPLSVSIN